MLLVPLLALYAASFLARRRALASFAGHDSALVSSSAARQVARAGLTVVAGAALVLALAGPYVDEREVEVRWRGIDLVVALDVSQSMGVQDVAPDRLQLGRAAIQSLVEQVSGSRVALVLFGAEGIVRYPATTDPRVLAGALDSLGRTHRPRAGSSLQAALDVSLEAFPAESGLPKAVLIVSDGEDFSAPDADVAGLRAAGIRLFALAVGTEAGGQVPTYDNTGKYLGPLVGADGQPVTSRMREDILRRLAEGSGGRAWRYAADGRALTELAGAIAAMGTGELSGATRSAPQDRYQILALLALGALLLEWTISDRRAMPRPRRARLRVSRGTMGAGALLAIVLASCGDVAATNETANDLFAAGDYQRALERYKALLRDRPDVPELSVNAGNALHRLGDFARAIPNYDAALAAQDRKIRAVALYDKGNTLFRQGKLDEAREAYVAALRLVPDDRDAKFNIELIDGLRTRPGQEQPPGGGQQPGQPSGRPQGQPGQSGAPGGSGTPQSGGPQGSADPSSAPGTPGDGGEESIEDALAQFRQNLTPEEALRVLEALLRQQRGLETFLEGGARRSGPNQPY